MSGIGLVIVSLMIAALLVAILGFIQILKQNKDSGKRSNKLMFLRIGIQATVILILFIIYCLN
jgi:hypothetical protein